MDDKPYLFEYDGIQNEVKYTLVYADSPEEAFTKLNKLINPTMNQTQIRLATIL
jgi:hypothetical protein